MIFLFLDSSLAHLEPKLQLFEVLEMMVRQIIIASIAMHNGRKSLILAPQEIPDISGYQWGFGCQFVKAYITENPVTNQKIL